MKKKFFVISIIVLFLLIFFVFYKIKIITLINLSVKNIYISPSVKEKCQEILNVRCGGECLDGWSQTCFYDSNKYNDSDFKLRSTIEPKDSCFAFFSNAFCGDCSKTFELKEENTFNKVGCEEFYQSIENKNKECNNCIKKIINAS